MYDISVADKLNHLTNVAFQVDEFDGETYKSAYCYETHIDGSGHYITCDEPSAPKHHIADVKQ